MISRLHPPSIIKIWQLTHKYKYKYMEYISTLSGFKFKIQDF